jgi:hypothetical protein
MIDATSVPQQTDRNTFGSITGRRSFAPGTVVASTEEAFFPPPSRVGVLYVKGFLNRWRRLTVELKNHTLVISIIRNGVLKRTFNLTPQTICEDSNVRHFCFCLTNEDEEKIFFSADNIASKEAWIDSIQSSLSLLRINHRKLKGKEKRKLHVNEVNQYINRPIIYVKIIRGRNFSANDGGPSSDPYVKITLGGSSVRTITRKKDQNPDWGMVFPFDWDSTMRYIRLEVWDEDYSNPEDFMGCVDIPVLPLKNGDCVRRWYPLGKKAPRNVVSGEIEVELSCTGQPDSDQLSWQFFQEVQKLPEFSINLAACSDGYGQVAIRNGPFGSLVTRSNNRPEGTSNVENTNTGTATNNDLLGFPFFYPSIEIECLEDISINVSILSCLNTGKVSAPGILILTSHRLIFISLNRILAQNECEVADVNSLQYNSGINIGNNMSSWGEDMYQKTFDEIDLSTEIPVNTVMSVHLTTESEVASGQSFEAIKLKSSDGRNLTLLFKDDSATYNGTTLNSLGASYLNRAIEQFFRGSDVAYLKRKAAAAAAAATTGETLEDPSLRETASGFNGGRTVSEVGSSRKNKVMSERFTNVTSLEAAWVKMIRSAPTSVIEATDSLEGPPAHRMYTRLKYKSLNRTIERYSAATESFIILNSLREACGLFTFPPPRSYVELIEGGVLESTELGDDIPEISTDTLLSPVNPQETSSAAEDADEDFLMEGIDGVNLHTDLQSEVEGNEKKTEGSSVMVDDIEVETTDHTESKKSFPFTGGVNEVVENKEVESLCSNSEIPQTVESIPAESPKIDKVHNIEEKETPKNGKSKKEQEKDEKLSKVMQKRASATIESLTRVVTDNRDLADAFTKLFFNFESNWHIFNPLKEFRRMGVPNNNWRITNVNARYDLCPTYPAVLSVPAAVEDYVLIQSAMFRSKGRFPTLSWVHRNGCSLSRCSQPLIGITNNRNEYDEKLLSAMNRAGQPIATGNGLLSSSPSITSTSAAHDLLNGSTQQNLKPFVIVDARPLLNAKANQAVGKGVESEKVYENVTVLFMDIANIHAVRKSMDILEEALVDETTWAKNLEASGWLTYIRKILIAAGRIAHCISREKVSVLVHCSDGWDRTSQLTSLAMILMDPYYRTLEGFIVLIEKEWFSFGHKFADRLGWTRDGWRDEEKSPIFVQFLDCVHQCLLQLPSAFEFNQQLLLFIMEHLYTGWFSNFLFNCEREMKEFEPWKSSVSIWTAVLSNKYMFVNDGYYPSDTLITPVVSKTRLVFWSEWFLRWHDRVWTFSWIETHQIDSKRLEAGNNVGAAQWVDDKSVSSCAKCNRRFSFFLRKHHCRCCGNIFCDPCSREVRIIPAVSTWRAVRCCVECAFNIDTSQLDDMSSEIRSTTGSRALSRAYSRGAHAWNPNSSVQSAQYSNLLFSPLAASALGDNPDS